MRPYRRWLDERQVCHTSMPQGVSRVRAARWYIDGSVLAAMNERSSGPQHEVESFGANLRGGLYRYFQATTRNTRVVKTRCLELLQLFHNFPPGAHLAAPRRTCFPVQDAILPFILESRGLVLVGACVCYGAFCHRRGDCKTDGRSCFGSYIG